MYLKDYLIVKKVFKRFKVNLVNTFTTVNM